MARATIVAAAFALALAVPGPAGAAETLGLEPDTVRPGTTVTVVDQAFADPKNTDLPRRCTISLDGEALSEDCAVNAEGELKGTFTVGDEVEEGEYEVEAKAEGDDDLRATAKLTVSDDAPAVEPAAEDEESGGDGRVVSTPAGRSTENGKTPVYVLVMVGVATLGMIVFRAWRARNPQAGGGNRMATGKAPKAVLDAAKPVPRDPNKPPPPKLNIPPPPKKQADGGSAPTPTAAPAAAAAAPAGGAAPAEGGTSPLRLRSRPDLTAEIVLVDLDAP